MMDDASNKSNISPHSDDEGQKATDPPTGAGDKSKSLNGSKSYFRPGIRSRIRKSIESASASSASSDKGASSDGSVLRDEDNPHRGERFPTDPMTYVDPFPVKDDLPIGKSIPMRQTGKGMYEARPLKGKGRPSNPSEPGYYVPAKSELKLTKGMSLKKILDSITQQEVAARPGVTIRQILMEKLVNAALDGDRWAIEQVMDRMEGKPAISIEHGAKDPSKFLADLSDDELSQIKSLAVDKGIRPAEKTGEDDGGSEMPPTEGKA